MDVDEHAELGEFQLDKVCNHREQVQRGDNINDRFAVLSEHNQADGSYMEHGTCSGLFPGRMYGDAAGCFGLHSDCNGMSGLVPTCRHEPLELWQKVAMSVG